MIAVLQNGQEVADSILMLQRKGLPLHSTPQKNWDHFLLHGLMAGMDRSCRIVDLGCGDGYTVDFLSAAGFKNIAGIDFQIGLKLRLKQAIRMWRAKTLAPPYSVRTGNLLKTRFPGETCDVVVSVSTIEHGVEVDGFLQEAARLLKPGGLLFVTTDYWEAPLIPPNQPNPFNLPWKVFSKREIEGFIAIASRFGLSLLKASSVPQCNSSPVFWNGLSYTFLALSFLKVRDSFAPTAQ